MASQGRKCLRFLVALFLLAICGFCFSGYFIDTRIYVGKLQLAHIVNGKDYSNIAVHDPEDKDPYDVIVLTYMRSGSTFIGKLLGARDDAFYWYEPLWFPHTWKYHSKGQLVCNYGKDDCQNIPSTSPESVQHSLHFLLDIYNCNLKGHFDRFADYWQTNDFGSTVAAAKYRKCLKPVKDCIKCLNDTSNKAVSRKHCGKCNECYDQWTKDCNNATHRVTKVLRLDTSHAKFLLENHKRLKLVQLFRDPRAIINSRVEIGWYYMLGRNFTINNDSEVLCKRIEDDLASALELKTLFPDRVKIIQYEDFYDPNRTAKIMYEFLNMKMTEYVKKTILAPPAANSPKNRNKRAGFHPDSYRDKLDIGVILATNKHCEKVFNKLGLRTFDDAKEVKNRNISVILDELPYPLD